jgi:hypothetical protein
LRVTATCFYLELPEWLEWALLIRLAFQEGKEIIVVSHWVLFFSFFINWRKFSSHHWMPMTPDLLSVNQIGAMILPTR